MSAPRVRVVVVAYRGDDDLRVCLKSLACCETDLFETVVVDNASSPETRAMVTEDFPEARYLDPGRNDGFSVGNNAGAAGFEGDYLLFLNPDTIMEPGVLAGLVAFLDDHDDAGAAGPKVKNSDGSRQMSFRRWPGLLTSLFNRYSLLTRLWPSNPWSRAYLMSDEDPSAPTPVDWLAACCVLVRRDVFEEIGGFDERYFMFCEDVDLCRRIMNAGRGRWYVPTVEMTHALGESAGERSAWIVRQRHRSMWRYFLSHGRWRPALAPFVLLGLTVRCAVHTALTLLRRR